MTANKRQAVYAEHNIEARSRNHCCNGKATSIAYYESSFLALGIQHAMRMRHIAICRLSGSKGKIFEKNII